MASEGDPIEAGGSGEPDAVFKTAPADVRFNARCCVALHNAVHL